MQYPAIAEPDSFRYAASTGTQPKLPLCLRLLSHAAPQEKGEFHSVFFQMACEPGSRVGILGRLGYVRR
jgi:hypothetical protein